jgi:gamma-glutamyl hercynylcysteine S-oxide synthase
LAKREVEEIAKQMERTRLRTLSLFDLAREEDLHESPGFGFRPIIWHLAHIGVFEAYWLLQKLKGEAAPDERFERIFDPINTPREESKNLPSRREMEAYLTRVRERTLRYLNETEFSEADPLLRDAFVFRLVLEHEQQHQETLAYLFHLLNPSKKSRPALSATIDKSNGVSSDKFATRLPAKAGEMASVAEGVFPMGANAEMFAYDNERPLHTVHVPAFRIDKLLTTNEEYAHFIKEGGYRRREWWSDEGWEWREREDWKAPLYWTQRTGEWRVKGMFDESLMAAELHPVTGVSWYEAEAYARFMKKRLPTEAEWEKAASWDAEREQKRRYSWGDDEPSPEVCNFNYHFWGTTPVGSFPEGVSAYGCLDMTGNVWEWTSSPFMGYPNFKAFPYPEYSETWFDGDHRVLKGGSWATQASTLRISFRNFFRRHFRIAFAGIRCAGDD